MKTQIASITCHLLPMNDRAAQNRYCDKLEKFTVNTEPGDTAAESTVTFCLPAPASR